MANKKPNSYSNMVKGQLNRWSVPVDLGMAMPSLVRTPVAAGGVAEIEASLRRPLARTLRLLIRSAPGRG